MKASTKNSMLLIVSVAIIGSYATYLTSKKDAITIQEKVLYGNKEDVKDVSLAISTCLDFEHFWDITTTLGNTDQATINYQYCSQGQSFVLPSKQGVSFQYVVDSQFTSFTELEEATFDEFYDCCSPREAIQDVLSRVATNQKYSETVLYRDYYEFYLFDIYEKIRNQDDKLIYFTDAAKDTMKEYFTFPVLQDDKINITIDTSAGDYQISTKDVDDDQDAALLTRSIVENNVFYLTVQYSDPTTVSTLSSIAIYYIPYYDCGDGIAMDIGDIQLLTTMTQNYSNVHSFEVIDDCIVMLVEKEGEMVFCTYQKEPFKLVSEIPLDSKNVNNYSLEVMDDSVYIGCDDSFYVYSKDDHQFNLEFHGTHTLDQQDVNLNEYIHQYYYIDDTLYILSTKDSYLLLDDFIITSYDRGGLLFAASYHNNQQDVLENLRYNSKNHFYHRYKLIKNT